MNKYAIALISVLTLSTTAFAAGGSDIGSSTVGNASSAIEQRLENFALSKGLSDIECEGEGIGYTGRMMKHSVSLKKGILKIGQKDARSSGTVTFANGFEVWNEGGVNAIGHPGSIEAYLVDKHNATLKRADYDDNGDVKPNPLYVFMTCK